MGSLSASGLWLLVMVLGGGRTTPDVWSGTYPSQEACYRAVKEIAYKYNLIGKDDLAGLLEAHTFRCVNLQPDFTKGLERTIGK